MCRYKFFIVWLLNKGGFMPSRIGVFLFSGLLLGTIIGHLVFRSPAVGALFLGMIGVAAAIYLDKRDENNNN